MKNSKRIKKTLLEHIRKTPNIELACEKSGIGRASVYRWKEKDHEFAKAIDEALVEGEARMNDISEMQLFTMIKEKKFRALSFYLRHRHPKYLERIPSVPIKEPTPLNKISKKDQELINKAIRLGLGKNIDKF